MWNLRNIWNIGTFLLSFSYSSIANNGKVSNEKMLNWIEFGGCVSQSKLSFLSFKIPKTDIVINEAISYKNKELSRGGSWFQFNIGLGLVWV